MWRLHPAQGSPDSRRLVELSAKKKKKTKGHLEVFLSPHQTSRVPAGLSVDSGRQKSLSIWCSVIVFLGGLLFFFFYLWQVESWRLLANTQSLTGSLSGFMTP